jgi:hypothetical protein
MNTEILEKLKKLLQLHKGATGAEAESALEKATTLAAKYNIDLALASIEQPKEEFTSEEILEGKRMSVTQRFISNVLQKHFNVDLVYSGSRYDGVKICFLGRKSDVEFALYVQSFLKEHMMRSWQYYQKTNNAKTRYRATFLEGFTRGLDIKLTEAKTKQENESFAGMATNIQKSSREKYSIVLVNNKKERDNFVKTKFPKLYISNASRLNIYGGDASSAGFNTGYTTNISRPTDGQLCLN